MGGTTMKMKMTRKLCLLAASAMTLSALTGCTAALDGGTMRKNMSAMDYAQEMGIGINLGNTMEAYWADPQDKTAGASLIGEDTPQNYETCWGAVVTTKEAIDGMAAAGFNTIRVPVYWGNMMEDDGKFEIDDAYIERVEEIIGYCLDNDLYVVLNVHHYDEFLIKNHPKEDVLEATEIIWEQIAGHFRDYSDYLIFEGFNEALGSQREGDTYTEDELFDYVNDMNQVFVDTVRESGGNNKNRMLIASGYWTNIDKTTDARYVLPEDPTEDRLMVSVHYIDNACYWTNNIGGDDWRAYSNKQCSQLTEVYTAQNIPVFVGECTSIYGKENIAKDADVTASSDCLSHIMHLAVDNGFIPVLWDVNDNFYSRTEFKIKSESDAAVIREIADKIENQE